MKRRDHDNNSDPILLSIKYFETESDTELSEIIFNDNNADPILLSVKNFLTESDTEPLQIRFNTLTCERISAKHGTKKFVFQKFGIIIKLNEIKWTQMKCNYMRLNENNSFGYLTDFL